MSLLTRIFGEPEEINGAHRCPTYLYRWFLYGDRSRDSLIGRIFGKPMFKVYLHHFIADDWSLDLHDHPKRFISFGLRGRYVELTPRKSDIDGKMFAVQSKTFTAPWVRSFPAEHIHRLRMVRRWDGSLEDCWTLVIVLRGTREWGFWHLGRFIPWLSYVRGADSHIADKMTACGDW
jgi:hypothetical protein